MKYLFLTLQYLFRLDSGKRFLALLLIALPPCILLAYFFPITGYFEWFFNYSGDYGSYSALWLSLAQRDSLGLGFLVLGYILLVLSVSAITTAVARSVRIGKFQLKNFLYLINENFFPSFYTITFFIIALMVAQSLIGLFLFLWQSLPTLTASFVVSIIFVLISLLLLVWAYSGLALWLPIMSINGLKPHKAIAASYSKTHNQRRELLISYIIIVAGIVLIGLISYLFGDVWYISWIINTLNYAIATVFFVVLSILSYFDIEGITREDLVKRPYLRR
ncbi:MAG: hypothetical protein WCS45_05410 [Clostridia bacterium]|jgi:hypothetical protein